MIEFERIEDQLTKGKDSTFAEIKIKQLEEILKLAGMSPALVVVVRSIKKCCG